MTHTTKNTRRSAFTIVELIVVIAVIAILAAIVLVSYGAWRTSIATASVKSDLEHAASAMESSRGFNNGYPLTMPSSFTASANNTIALSVPNTKSYCIDGTTSFSSSIKFYIDNLTQTNGASAGTCTTRTSLPVPGTISTVQMAISAAEIDLVWPPASPNYAAQYTAQCAQDPAFITGLLTQVVSSQVVNSDGSSYVAFTSDVQLNTTYYCRIRAENNNGQSAWSIVVSGDAS